MIKKETLEAKLKEVNKQLQKVDKETIYGQFEYGYLKGQKDLIESLWEEIER